MMNGPLRIALVLLLLGASARADGNDARNLKNGSAIPDEGYCDQPYVVVLPNGDWLCTLTTGQGKEGQQGQHIVSTISKDQGKTWSDLNDIEPADGPEASWVMPLLVPGGRVYVFYTYNADNLRVVPEGNSPGINKRVDTLGTYAFKYSDDGGKTWSRDRHKIPMRLMRLDRENNVGGKFLFFWGVGKPMIHQDAMYFGFAKVGKWGAPGGMVKSQGVFMKSTNILTERDPSKLHWELLPDGDEGLHTPKGPVSDEANLVGLSDGSLYATYRTIDGYNCAAYSRDGGHTWTKPAYATYTPGGRRLKHPRAANFVRKFSNGKYLLWYHNHGGEPFHEGARDFYAGRNPAWIVGGIEKDGFIHWSQPEILLYDDDPKARISYPDFIEDDGRFFVTETQKTIARVHEIDPKHLDGVWNQLERAEVVRDGLVLDLPGDQAKAGKQITMPKLPDLSQRGGFTLEFWVKFDELTAGQTILNTRVDKGKGRGVRLETSDRSTIRLVLNDGKTEAVWDSDPGTHEGTLKVGPWQHVVATVDAGPRIITFLVDGTLNDGGAVREFGWGRFAPELGDLNGLEKVDLAPTLLGQIKGLRIYDRPLRTSEAVSNWRSGTP
ncbi:MAG: sialidase family protein [Isosphaeraceae bacterium]